jgi:hypothetical protein
MSFIAKHIVTTDERLIVLSRLHWIYIVKGLLWLVLSSLLGIGLDLGLFLLTGKAGIDGGAYFDWLPMSWQIHTILAMCIFVGVMVFFMYLLKVTATEIALTTQRVIYKTGLFFVEVEEVVLDEISSERVDHGILGRLFDYGKIHFDMRFVGDVDLPAVRDPYRLLRAIHKLRGIQHNIPL